MRKAGKILVPSGNDTGLRLNRTHKKTRTNLLSVFKVLDYPHNQIKKCPRTNAGINFQFLIVFKRSKF